MKNESNSQNYERAAKLRDRIRALSKISNEKYSDLNNRENFDIIFLKKNMTLFQFMFFSSDQ